MSAASLEQVRDFDSMLDRPEEPLNEAQLHHCVNLLRIPHFRGVFTIDTLPRTARRMECGITTTSKVTGGSDHWIAWMVRKGEALFHDSGGLPPPPQLIRYLKKFPLSYMNSQSQSLDTDVCGHACVGFLYNCFKKGNFDFCSLQDKLNRPLNS